MTITLTERERIVFDALASFLAECSGTAPSIIGLYIFDWLAMQPTESASPSCAPGASAHLDGEGVESGPGQPIDSGVVDKAVAWDQCQRSHQRGFRAGIEAAANWHMEAAAEWETADISDADRLKAREYAKQHRADAARIRTLKLPENANG